jgi:protein JSN1
MLPEKECAFVNFLKLEDALSARDKMHGGVIGNTVVRIGFGKTDSIQDTQTIQPTKSLWVGNIPSLTKPAELGAIFEKYGKVESARVLVLFFSS